MMEWFSIVEKSVPWAADAWKAIRKSKSRRLHIYVLKAIGHHEGVFAPRLDGVRFDIASIERKLRIVQVRDAAGGVDATDDFLLFGAVPETKDFQKKLKKQIEMGLPGLCK